MAINPKIVQNLQSKIAAVSTDYELTELTIQMNETEFYVAVKGVKKPAAAK